MSGAGTAPGPRIVGVTDGPGELVVRAREGDQQAWNQLVERYTGLVWAIARSYRLSRADGADVNQTVWLRLLEHLDRIADPDKAGAWIATVCRNECKRTLRRAGRELLTDHDADVVDVRDEPPDMPLLRDERYAELWASFGELPPRCQALLRLLMADPPPSYLEVAAALEMPVGSIGPTRMRCVARLRRITDGRITELS
jgi:RNA polymerase sigma factor (sigma-70 family)